MANITHLVSEYVDLLPAADRLKALESIQTYGRVWLPLIADELGTGVDYSASIVELAAFAALPDDFATFISSIDIEAAARKVAQS